MLPFHCSDEDLNNFLIEDSKNYLADLMAVTYLIIDNDNQQIAAYFSLLNNKVAYDPLSNGLWNRINRLIHNIKRRRSYPSVKISVSYSNTKNATIRDRYMSFRVKAIVLWFAMGEIAELIREDLRFSNGCIYIPMRVTINPIVNTRIGNIVA